MSIEVIAILSVVVILGGAFVFFALAKRVLKLAIRLTLFFVLILFVIAGLLFAWYGRSNSKPSSQQDRPANTRRGNSR